MVFFQNTRNYPVLLTTFRGSNVTVPPHGFVEGEFFARFSMLTEVAESAVDKSKLAYSEAKFKAASAPVVRPVAAEPEKVVLATPEPPAPPAVVEEPVEDKPRRGRKPHKTE